jgi:hypothetical protein
MTYALSAAITAAIGLTNWLPATPDEFDTFTKHGNFTCTFATRQDGRVYAASVGTAGDRVAFVVIAIGRPGKPLTSPVESVSSCRTRPDGTTVRESISATLHLPAGGKVRLPLRRQLIEVVDGNVRFSDRRVTPAEVRAYLDSKQKQCSLDDLLRFVDARRNMANK